MKLKIFFAAALIALTFTFASAQSNSSSSAHRRAHSEQLAANRNRMDKDVLNSIIRDDLTRREQGFNSHDNQVPQMINDLLTEAKRHIGKKYVHGAKGPNQFDCSGFTSYVYKQFGYTISPASRMQYTEGKPVSRDQLRKGDLVFFTSRSSGKNVGHVGIVWEVDHANKTFKFIHASIRGVKISNFEGYYVPRYVGAKRIID